MRKQKKPIQIKFLKEAEQYFFAQNEKVQERFLMLFDKTALGLKGDWFKKLKNSKGIFEFRHSDSHKFYRILAFWSSEEKHTLIIATHGFDKKRNKTPQREILRAEKLKEKYLDHLNEKK